MLLYSLLEGLDIKRLLLFLIAILLITDFLKHRKAPNFPPGPWALPVVGNVFHIDTKQPHIYLTKLAEVYGNIFSIRLGREKTVLVTGYKMVKEALVTQAENFVDRPPSPMADRLYSGNGKSFHHTGHSPLKLSAILLKISKRAVQNKQVMNCTVCSRTGKCHSFMLIHLLGEEFFGCTLPLSLLKVLNEIGEYTGRNRFVHSSIQNLSLFQFLQSPRVDFPLKFKLQILKWKTTCNIKNSIPYFTQVCHCFRHKHSFSDA
ncbi:hypothetical protein ANANG_G00077560 [Anguilla anguilla]|uniref:Cytochrome P450 n=1 Tax=Anguilla anguilla TaxID=7936 RepID=A0A9D3MJD1_ANGAN|nr:hypothetical protein ANANG_G00077560 [Anguilla anguilla]